MKGRNCAQSQNQALDELLTFHGRNAQITLPVPHTHKLRQTGGFLYGDLYSCAMLYVSLSLYTHTHINTCM